MDSNNNKWYLSFSTLAFLSVSLCVAVFLWRQSAVILSSSSLTHISKSEHSLRLHSAGV